jgi:hypothetical protein
MIRGWNALPLPRRSAPFSRGRDRSGSCDYNPIVYIVFRFAVLVSLSRSAALRATCVVAPTGGTRWCSRVTSCQNLFQVLRSSKLRNRTWIGWSRRLIPTPRSVRGNIKYEDCAGSSFLLVSQFSSHAPSTVHSQISHPISMGTSDNKTMSFQR